MDRKTIRHTEAKRELATRFPLKDLGRVHFFLGIRIIWQTQERKITLCQDQYIESILKRFGLEDCYTVSIPIEPGIQLTTQPKTADSEEDTTLYRSMLGSVMYLMLCTRPDLAYAIGALSKFSANP